MTLSTEPVALSFYAAIVATIFLSYTVIRRMNRDNKRKEKNLGCFSGGYVTLVIGSLCLLFFPFVTILVQSTYAYIDYPRYESTVVDVESGWEEQSYTDSDGRSRTRDVLMHTAIIEFTDKYGQKVRTSNSIRSGSKPNIGDTITVSYKDGKLQEFSFRAIALFIGLGFMLLIMGYCLLLIYNYAFKRSNVSLIDTGVWFGLHIIVPGGMLLMFSGMLYALIEYFLGNKDDMPLVIVFVLIFFCLVLFLALIGYISMLFGKKDKK